MEITKWLVEKLNPAQVIISGGGTTSIASESPSFTYQQCYEQLEVLNRGINMIVDDTAAVDYQIGESTRTTEWGMRKQSLTKILNIEPNPYEDINAFRRKLVLDLLLDGNIFIYFDGTHMYHLPAVDVVVKSDPLTFIESYSYKGMITYKASEIIQIKDNSYRSIFRGDSRLRPTVRTMNLILEMRKFQENLFKNGAIPGLVLTTDDILNVRMKDRLTQEWRAKFKPGTGGRSPVILDGGLKIDQISNLTFQELDFQNGIVEAEKVILKSLGIPPILLDSGNNANIRPNHRLYYLETIVPILNKITSAYKRFFGFDVYEDISYIDAMRPELSDQATYLNSLVNAGIMTRNEARDQLGLKAMSGHDELVIPQNIAGSAVDSSQGGAPKKKDPAA